MISASKRTGRWCKSLVTVDCFIVCISYIICDSGVITTPCGCCVGILFSGGTREGGPLTPLVLCQQPRSWMCMVPTQLKAPPSKRSLTPSLSREILQCPWFS